MRRSSYFPLHDSEEELISSNVKDKQSKISFLKKTIDWVQSKVGVEIDAKPAKSKSSIESADFVLCPTPVSLRAISFDAIFLARNRSCGRPRG